MADPKKKAGPLDGCPLCDLDLTNPDTPGHVCITYAEQEARVAARVANEGPVMPIIDYDMDQA